MTLPPGQHAIDGFPRFGTHLHRPPPPVPAEPAVAVRGAVAEPFDLPLADLADRAALGRTSLTADFHCVAGWSATGLRWEGVAFAALYRAVIEPAIRPGATVTHLGFRGLDGYRSVVTLEDALAPDVLIADRLDGRPLDADHGAPVRLVSPGQYGFVSTKHLCRIDLLTAEPEQSTGSATALASVGLRALGFGRHSRARVWREERGGHLPNVVARPVYRLLVPPIRALCARGSRR